MARQGVLVIGSMNFDYFYTLPHQMRLGENLHATSFETACGGKGANQAVQCAKLEVQTRMLGCLGRDAQGDRIFSEMTAYGVDMQLVRRVDVPTGNASVWVFPKGLVQAAIFGGANMCVTKDQIDEINSLLLETEAVILQNEIPMDVVSHAILAAKTAGCKVLYNAAPALPVSPEVLAAVDVLLVNEAEASFYSGVTITDEASARDGADKLLPLLRSTLIITLGSLGSLIAGPEGKHLVPAKRVAAVETTGAGDSFTGALADGLLRGLSIEKAAAFATAAAAVTVSKVGAQPAMPTRRMLLDESSNCMV